MPRFLVRPVFWRDRQGNLRRLSLVLDRREVLGPRVFAFRPSASENRLGQWLVAEGISPLDVEVALPQVIPEAEGERLSLLAT